MRALRLYRCVHCADNPVGEQDRHALAPIYYQRAMLYRLRTRPPDGFIEPCQPIGAAKPPLRGGLAA
jgi:hypothetical protein